VDSDPLSVSNPSGLFKVTFDTKIELEIWEGVICKRELLSAATPPALREALARLDGDRIDSVWIEIEGIGALTVGGGPNGFVVVAFPVDGSSSHLVVDDDDGCSVSLQVGGQVGNYPRAMVLTAEHASAIAENFLLSGSFDPSLRWIMDCPP
jgi:hypothetical protein